MDTCKLNKTELIYADTFLKRLFGLMFLKQFPRNKLAMLFKNSNWIHTLFMKIPIDVLYLDKQYTVIDIQENLRPWRIPMPRFKAKHILELRAGTIKNRMIKIQQRIVF